MSSVNTDRISHAPLWVNRSLICTTHFASSICIVLISTLFDVRNWSKQEKNTCKEYSSTSSMLCERQIYIATQNRENASLCLVKITKKTHSEKQRSEEKHNKASFVLKKKPSIFKAKIVHVVCVVPLKRCRFIMKLQTTETHKCSVD